MTESDDSEQWCRRSQVDLIREAVAHSGIGRHVTVDAVVLERSAPPPPGAGEQRIAFPEGRDHRARFLMAALWP